MASLMNLPTSTQGPLARYHVALQPAGGTGVEDTPPWMQPYSNQQEAEAWYRSMYGDPGPMSVLSYGGGGQGQNARQGWLFEPDTGIQNTDQTQIRVVDYNGDTDTYTVMLKTGDKEGTVYAYQGNGQGGYDLNTTPVQTVPWDTNDKYFKDPQFRQAVSMIALMAGGAMAAYSGLLGPEMAGFASAPGANTGIFSGLSTVAGGAANAGVSAAEFAAADAAQLAAQGLSETQIAQVLTSTGLDPFIAADAAQLAAQGLNEAAIMQNITASYGTELTGGAGAYMQGGGAYGYAPGVGTTFDEAGNVINLRDTPGYNAPPESPGPGDGIDNAGPPTPPGDPGKLPNPPGGPPGNNVNPNPNDPNWLNYLLSMVDMWNKYQGGKDQMEFFNNWTNKIFGQSDKFENMLMGTYTDPKAWLTGPEGQALNSIVQNQNLRTDARAGNLSNDTNRSVVLQNKMMQGLNDYRGGLTNAANIGRSQSGAVMRGAGEAFKGFQDSRNFYTPITTAGGTNQAGLQDIWNMGKDIWKTGREFWDWING